MCCYGKTVKNVYNPYYLYSDIEYHYALWAFPNFSSRGSTAAIGFINYSPSNCFKSVRISFFCQTQKKIFWRMSLTKQVMRPSILWKSIWPVWLHIFFKTSYLCSAHRFGTTSGWGNDRIFIFGWTIPLIQMIQLCSFSIISTSAPKLGTVLVQVGLRCRLFGEKLNNVISTNRDLNLKRPIYQSTACYGHFGRSDFPWEMAKTLKV